MKPTRPSVALFGIASFIALFLAAVLVATLEVRSVSGQEADATKTPAVAAPQTTPPAATETKPPEANPFPFVVRIDKSALLRYTDSEVDDKRAVDQYVLGAHAVGTSRTEGEIRGALIPDSKEAAFDIVFTGQSATKTVGLQEPALIYSRTFTDFKCTHRIIFDPRKGFLIAGDADVEGTTRLVYDGFASTRELGRRLIVKIAERKAGQVHEQARLIADRDNKKIVSESFEVETAKQVKEANKGLDLVRYINRFLGEKSNLQMFAKSSTDCIHIGIGPEGEKYAPMTELPPSREKSAPVEVWVHASILGEPVAAVMKMATPESKLSNLEQTKILGVLSFGAPKDEPAMDMALQDGWLVFALPEAALPPPPAPTAMTTPTATK
jgi:hypothetical protein